MISYTKKLSLLLFIGAALASCSTVPKTSEARQTLHDRVTASISDYKQNDPGMQRFFDNAYGYAVFPSIGEGAVGVGGAYGHGELYQGGRFVGYTNMTQGTIGVQLGGQSFSEIIFFKTKGEFEAFQSGQFEFDAAASAVAASSGASTAADYKKGVLVFTKAEGGLMVQAAIGGQKFNFVSEDQTANERP